MLVLIKTINIDHDFAKQVCDVRFNAWRCGAIKETCWQFGGATGRYLIIQLFQDTSNPLTLCHVEAEECKFKGFL